MKNNEKMDINLSAGISEEELTPEEIYNLNYETALRYIGIAEHMKQAEDQDKYYHRAIVYLKKINEDGRFDEQIKELRLKKFKARVEGKISLYEEASRIRDNAKTAQDYYAAQTIFLRIHKYEAKHPIREKWVSPEAYQKSLECLDSKEQADYCEKMALQTEAAQKRKSLFASAAVILVIIALLAFTRTESIHKVRAFTYNVLGDYTHEFQQYHALYEHNNDPDVYEKYLDARYRSGMKALEQDDLETAYADFKALAKEAYKDSQEKFFHLEQKLLKNGELGEVVHYAQMDWRVLEIQEDKVLLLKDHALGSTPFNNISDNVGWKDSTVRTWLNTTFLEENFFPDEISGIIDTDVVTEADPYNNISEEQVITTDKLFLLSVDEVNKYTDQIHTTKTCWWLRTPGTHEGSQAFVLQNKEIMDYGYDVACDQISVKPAIWVSLK